MKQSIHFGTESNLWYSYQNCAKDQLEHYIMIQDLECSTYYLGATKYRCSLQHACSWVAGKCMGKSRAELVQAKENFWSSSAARQLVNIKDCDLVDISNGSSAPLSAHTTHFLSAGKQLIDGLIGLRGNQNSDFSSKGFGDMCESQCDKVAECLEGGLRCDCKQISETRPLEEMHTALVSFKKARVYPGMRCIELGHLEDLSVKDIRECARTCVCMVVRLCAHAHMRGFMCGHVLVQGLCIVRYTSTQSLNGKILRSLSTTARLRM